LKAINSLLGLNLEISIIEPEMEEIDEVSSPEEIDMNYR
jgi:hypothetical protein